MSKAKISGWDAKPRTVLRSIRPGDLFLFALGSGRYGVGRILTAVSLGHVAEFFEPVLDQPDVAGFSPDAAVRRGRPLIIDSYSLFDRKLEGDWRIVARQENFVPRDVDDVFFTYGDASNRRRVDVHDRETAIDADEASRLPRYSPNGDWQVRNKLYGAD
jgi:Immunity protein 26